MPVNPNAEGIYMAIKRALKKGLDLEDEDLKQKLVSFACDGAAVMVGKNKECQLFYKGISSHH